MCFDCMKYYKTGIMVCWRVLLHHLYHTFRCVHKIVKCDCWLCHVCVSPSVYVEQCSSHLMDFMKFDSGVFFENLLRKFTFHKNWTRIMGALHVDKYTFLIISHLILLRMRNVSGKNQNTHFLFSKFFFF
jgi:flavoprotein